MLYFSVMIKNCSFHLEKDNTKIVHLVHRAEVGKAASLFCNSYGDTMWFYDAPSTNPISTSTQYVIDSAVFNNAGHYFCYGTYKSSILNVERKGKYGLQWSNEHFLAQTELRVYGKLKR